MNWRRHKLGVRLLRKYTCEPGMQTYQIHPHELKRVGGPNPHPNGSDEQDISRELEREVDPQSELARCYPNSNGAEREECHES